MDLSEPLVREDFALEEEQFPRLDAFKRDGATLARTFAGDGVALILFGSETCYAAPFTYETKGVARRIEEAIIGIPGRATDIADALGRALKRVDGSSSETKVVVLLSNGVHNAGATNLRAVA